MKFIIALALVAAHTLALAANLVQEIPMNDGKGTVVCVYDNGVSFRRAFNCPAWI